MDSQQAKKAVWSTRKYTGLENFYLFDLADLDHTERLYNKYKICPESLEKVQIDLFIQRENLTRYAIKELDMLLEVNGVFEVNILDSRNHNTYFLSTDQIKYEFSVSTNGRYILSSSEKKRDILTLEYKKKVSVLPKDDQISKWTFGTITNGKKLDSLNNLINTIHAQNIPEYEILICGPYPASGQPIDYSKVLILPDVIMKEDSRFPISTKKNRIISSAKFNNLCILHDRFSLDKDWYGNMKNYGNYFDYLCLPTIDKNGNRFTVDWMTFSYPLTKLSHKNRFLDYNNWSPDIIIQGGVIIGKKHLMQQNILDERLHWGELEDIQFSKAAYLNGSFFYIDVKNSLVSESVNHVPVVNSILRNIKELLYSKYSYYRDYLKFKSQVRQYYKI